MKIAVLGLGKLGLPLALVLAKAEYKVVGLDISEERLEEIEGFYKKEANEPQVSDYLQKYGTNLQLTADIELLKDIPIVIMITQSPSLSDGSFDSTYIEKAVNEVHNINKNTI